MRCCRPIPGDPIIGYLSAGRGIVVHSGDCPNLAKYRKHPEQWLDVRWEKRISGAFRSPSGWRSRTSAGRSPRWPRPSPKWANIDTVSVEELDSQNSAIELTVEVRDRVHLARIMRRIRGHDIVLRIGRKKG